MQGWEAARRVCWADGAPATVAGGRFARARRGRMTTTLVARLSSANRVVVVVVVVVVRGGRRDAGEAEETPVEVKGRVTLKQSLQRARARMLVGEIGTACEKLEREGGNE